MKKSDATFDIIRTQGCSWWIHHSCADWLSAKVIPFLAHPENLPGFTLIKETATRRIFRISGRQSNSFYIVKIFYRPHWSDKLKSLFRASRSRKEWRIAQELSDGGVPTYQVVACGAARNCGLLTGDYLISKEIAGVQSLMTWLAEGGAGKERSFFEKRNVVEGLARFVRAMHDAGVYPSDFHPGNLLVGTDDGAGPRFYVIDLHSIKTNRKITLRDRVVHLVCLNSLYLSNADRLRFLVSYLGKGGLAEVSTEALAREIISRSDRHRRALWKKRRQKSLQPRHGLEKWNCDAWRGLVGRAVGSEEIVKSVRGDILGESKGTIIKRTSRTIVKEVGCSGNSTSWIVKQYKICGWLARVTAPVRSSRAKRAWVNAHNLVMRGIPTPIPIAYGEKRRWGIVRESFFITEKIERAEKGDLFLEELAKNSSNFPNASLKEDFLVRLARLVRWMHQTNIHHGDLKAGNILVTVQNERPLIYLVDMDGVRIRRSIGRKDIVKDLSRIKAALSGVLSPSDQGLFLEIYGKDNTFFQDNRKRITENVERLAADKIRQKQRRRG